MRRFTLLRVDLSHEDDDPRSARSSKQYDAETLPAVRIVSPDGQAPRRGIVDGELLHAERFLRKSCVGRRCPPN